MKIPQQIFVLSRKIDADGMVTRKIKGLKNTIVLKYFIFCVLVFGYKKSIKRLELSGVFLTLSVKILLLILKK